MPFKSDKQRKWMYANDPEMAKKWEKEETLREKLRGVIKQEMKSMQAYSKSTQKAIDIDDEDDEKHESVNEVRLVGYDKSYLDNAKKRLKVPHEITNIEYNQTRYRGPHDKFVKIFYKLKWKPGTRLDTEEKYVSVFYDSPERLKMIGKTLKLKLKESVNEKVANPFSEHLRKAQDEIEYMISNGPTPDGDDGVYDKPNQAMKLLQIAQKSLGKIK